MKIEFSEEEKKRMRKPLVRRLSLITAFFVPFYSYILFNIQPNMAEYGECIKIHNQTAAEAVKAGNSVRIYDGKLHYTDFKNTQHQDMHVWLECNSGKIDKTASFPKQEYKADFSYQATANILSTLASIRIYEFRSSTPKAIWKSIILFRHFLKETV